MRLRHNERFGQDREKEVIQRQWRREIRKEAAVDSA